MTKTALRLLTRTWLAALFAAVAAGTVPADAQIIPPAPAQLGPPMYAPPTEPIPGPSYVLPGYITSGPNFGGTVLDQGNMGSTPEEWTFQVLPSGLMYHSYLAGDKEPRLGQQFFYLKGWGWMWDVTLGARVPLMRFGTEDRLSPEGFQMDVEGAAFPRLDIYDGRTVVANDYRAGVPFTYRNGPWEFKFAYAHTCSHLGDQYIEENPGVERVEDVRDSIVLGAGFHPIRDIRIYGEVSWAANIEGVARPWEIQFGVEYSPAMPTGWRGAPFLAMNVHLREEVSWGGDFELQTGWQWRGDAGQLWRFGFHYFNGLSNEYQFYNQWEQQIGVGMWYDF